MPQLVFKTCRNCDSQNIVRDAHVMWEPSTKKWFIDTMYEWFICNDCGLDGPADKVIKEESF